MSQKKEKDSNKQFDAKPFHTCGECRLGCYSPSIKWSLKEDKRCKCNRCHVK